MKHLLTFTKTCWAVILVAAIGFESYGCSDSASVSEDVAVPLSSLTITPGTLQPGFFKNTTSYTVKAPTGAATITVTATPKDSTTTMTINGAVTASGQGRSVSLGVPGSTVTILIVLASQNGLETTYTVTVTRLLSSDDDLSALTVKVGNTAQTLMPIFDANNPDYTVDVANTVGQVSVVATKSDKDASMVISSGASSTTVGPGVNPGQLLVTLGGPGTAAQVSIEVTAPNSSKKTYHVNINRLSGDNNLKALTVSPGTLKIQFDPAIITYTVDVAYTVEQVTLSATKSDQNAAMSGSLNALSGTPTDTKTLGLGGHGTSTDFLITVAATDPNVPTKTYKITVHRATPSSNYDLSDLSLRVGTNVQPLSPPFTKNTTEYTANVATEVEEVIVSIIKDDPNAVVGIRSVTIGAGTPSGEAPITLTGAGTDTSVTVQVTAQNGILRPTPYTVIVKRAAPAAPLPPASAPDMTDASDSGTNNTDNITSIGTPSFVVPQPAAGETPSIYVNGSKVLDATFDQTTNIFTLITPLSDGTYSITSTVTNLAGFESAPSPSLTVIIDPAAP